MQGKLNKNIGFSLIPFAFIFLFDPYCGLFDTLPDFLGYFILCFSLANLADINDKIAVASKAFQKGVILSVLRFASIFALDRFFADEEKTVGLLLFVFVSAILELLFIIPGYRALFEGLLTLGTFEGGEAVFYKKHENGKNATEKTYSLTLAFLIIKNVICALSEFTSLQSNSSYEFVNITRILAIIFVMPVALIWLVKIVLYFNRIKSDGGFIQALSSKYLDKSSATPEYFIYKALTFGLYAILISFVFTFDFYTENVNVLPDFLFYSIIIFSCLYLRKYSRNQVGIIISSTFGVLISLATYILEKNFFARFDITAVIKDLDAYNQYNLLVILYAVKAITFIVTLFFILRFVHNIFLIYIGKKHPDNDSYFSEHSKTFKIRNLICFLLGFLSAIATVYRVVSLPNFDISWIFYYSGIITSVIEIAFIISAITLILFLHGEIKYNYKTYL